MLHQTEITYTPGRLAKKIGVSRSTLMNHLRNSGLISQCSRTPNGYLRIPYHIAVEICSPEALAIREIEASRKPNRVRMGGQQSLPESEAVGNSRAADASRIAADEPLVRTSRTNPLFSQSTDYAQIGRTLRKAGITLKDVINYCQKQGQATQPINAVVQPLSPQNENAPQGDAEDIATGELDRE